MKEIVQQASSVLTVPLGTPEDLKKSLLQKFKLKGRQPDEASMDEVQTLLAHQVDRRDLLIENLHVINDAYRGLHERHLIALAQLMKISMAEVYEVATFYHHFEVLRDDQEAPKLTVRVCESLACEMAGSKDLLERLPSILGRDDVNVIPVPCVGRCEQAPVAIVHQHPVVHADTKHIQALVHMGLEHHPKGRDIGVFAPAEFAQKSITQGITDQIDQTGQTNLLTPDYCGYDTYQEHGGYQLLKEIDQGAKNHESVISALEHSGLRGLGGAGFPAGRKWRIVREQAAPKLMAVNIDEGEPGTFKDRTYLERDPHRFLEGMLIAAKVVGVEACYIYLRDEYHGCRELLQVELSRLEANPPCDLPKIELRRGAGAYICGEESAMIESIEGKRGEPRMRPPYIAQVGLFGRPTLEHNFETLYWVRDIVEKGADWFSGFGRHGRKGLRSFSVSGRVKQPGVKLAPAGITVQELIDEYCGGMQEGHELYAYLPGGASGGILPANLNQIPLDFDTLQEYGCFIGSAAVVILSQADRARDAALNIMHFFMHESCGQCTPCRVGTSKAATLMSREVWDLQTLNDLSEVMADASICGLGQAAPNPIRCIQKYFPQEIVK
jgi:formate dehydrogenase